MDWDVAGRDDGDASTQLYHRGEPDIGIFSDTSETRYIYGRWLRRFLSSSVTVVLFCGSTFVLLLVL